MTVIAFISAIAMMNAHLRADCGMTPTYSVPMRQIRHKPHGECNECPNPFGIIWAHEVQ